MILGKTHSVPGFLFYFPAALVRTNILMHSNLYYNLTIGASRPPLIACGFCSAPAGDTGLLLVF